MIFLNEHRSDVNPKVESGFRPRSEYSFIRVRHG